jgi:hypothetical protein
VTRKVKRVNLVRIQGATSTHIDAEITNEGDLLFSGQDVGEDPKQFFGDIDYEYWLQVKASEKDRVLLAVIKKLYSGNPSAFEEFKEFLESKHIPCEFSSYV